MKPKAYLRLLLPSLLFGLCHKAYYAFSLPYREITEC